MAANVEGEAVDVAEVVPTDAQPELGEEPVADAVVVGEEAEKMETSGLPDETEDSDDEMLQEALLNSLAAALPDQDQLPLESTHDIKYDFNPKEDAEKIRKYTKHSSKLIAIDLCDFDTKLQHGQLRELNQRRVKETQMSVNYSIPTRPCRVTLVEKSGVFSERRIRRLLFFIILQIQVSIGSWEASTFATC